MVAKTTTSTPQDTGRLARPKSAAGRAGEGGGERRIRTPSLLTFFQEARAELRKVTWPTRQEAINLTAAVIGMTVALAAFLGGIDAGLDKLVAWMLGTG